MEQTKGYFRLKGKIWGLNNKEPFTNGTGAIRSLSIGIQSSKENSNYVQIGKFASGTLNVKIKGEGMEEVLEIGEQQAIDKVKEVFKDGDSVYVNLRVEPNTFTGKLDYLVSQIYIEKEPIDFNADNFEEVNELVQTIVVTEKPESGSVKGGLVSFNGQLLELDLKLDDEIVNEYFQDNIKVGDLVPVSIYVFNKPIYEGEGESTERTTLKGKIKKSGGQKIVDRVLELQISDVDTSNIKSKLYDREEIRQARELTEESKNNTSTKTPSQEIKNDDDLPY